MAEKTKLALRDAFYKVVSEKPLSKVTISDITDTCGVSRMTFYYHFKDIDSLLAWTCRVNCENLILNNKDISDWKDAFRAILKATLHDKSFLMNVYPYVPHENVRAYYVWVMDVLNRRILEMETRNLEIVDSDVDFILHFANSALADIVIVWLDGGMRESDIDELIVNVDKLLTPAIPAIIKSFAK